MNKTQLAKLLIKHPEIKALYESRAFDTSTINKVIAEEIVREQEDDERTPESYAAETEALKQQYDEMIEDLKSEENDEKRKAVLDDLLTARGLLRDSMRKLQAAIKQEMEDYGEDDVDPELQQFAEKYRERRGVFNTAIKELGKKVDEKSAEVAQSPSIEDDAQLTDKLQDATIAIQNVADDSPGSEEEPLQKVDTSVKAVTTIDKALDDIEVEDGDAANASNDGEENAEGTAQEPTHLEIMKKIFGENFETEYPILSKDEKFLELLAKAIAEKRNVPAQDEEEANPVNENQETDRAAEIEKLQAALNEYENGSLAGIDVADIAKTTQSLKDKPSGFIELFKQVVSSAIAEKVADEIVKPILEKINAAATVGQGIGAAGTAAGGSGLLLVGLSLAGKFILGKAVEVGVSSAVEAGVRKLINEGLDLIPGIEKIENFDAVFTKILGEQVFDAIQEQAKTGNADVESIKALVAANWKQILRNFVVVSTDGDLGDNLQEWSTGFMSYEISIPKVGEFPVGAMLSELIGFTPEEIASANDISDKLEQAKQENPELAQAADEETGSETTDDTEDQTAPSPQLPAGKGWDNAKNSVSNVLKKDDMTVDKIKTALSSLEEFKKLFKPRSGAEEKFAQAEGLEDYMIGRLNDIQAKAQSAQTKEELPTEDIENLAATYMSYIDYLNALPQEPQFKEDFQMPDTIPATKEEFQQQFIEPIAPEGATVTVAATVGTSTEDYIALGKQVIQQAGDLLSEFTDNEVVQRFLGWYVGERSKEIAGQSPQNLQEIHPDKDERFAPFSSTILRYDDIKKFQKRDHWTRR